MTMRMLIDARHREETRVAVVKGNRIEEFDFESAEHKQLKGNIYLAKVIRVEPSLQAAFVDYGGNRHGFLAFSEIHPDYYQIPKEDRDALIREEAEHAAEEERLRGEEDDDDDSDFVEEVGHDDHAPEEVGSHQADDGEHDEPAEPMRADTDDEFVATEAAGGDELTDTPELFDGDEQGGAPRPAPSTASGNGIDEGAAENLREKRFNLRRRYKIQDVIRRRQVLLVQVVKEERGNKGAALTNYLSLAGRYCVLMPNTTAGGGISRKISNGADRKRLKSIMADLNLPRTMGCIVRTAGLQRTRVEIKRDFDYLARLWDEIRETTLKSAAPALVYQDSDLIKRAIRDIYNKDIDEIIVEGEAGYTQAKTFMRLLMPSHARRVQRYSDTVPLYQRNHVEDQLAAMYQPVVQLKSGGYLVINPTEALVSIDINSGRSTREHGIEATAVGTNLEAAPEIARQLRLRDMAGLVVIDFIDMENSGNNRKVERAMKNALADDRARIQIGRISSFGLMEMSRQRLRTGVLEASTRQCPHCEGTGLVRTASSAGLSAVRMLEDEAGRGRGSRLVLRASQEAALYVLNRKRLELSDIEDRFGVMIEIASDGEAEGARMTVEASGPPPAHAPRLDPPKLIEDDADDYVEEIDEEEDEEVVEERQEREPRAREGSGRETSARESGEAGRKRRRRGRRGRRDEGGVEEPRSDDAPSVDTEAGDEPVEAAGSEAPRVEGEVDGERRPRRGRRGGRRRRGRDGLAEQGADEQGADEQGSAAPESADDVQGEQPVDEDTPMQVHEGLAEDGPLTGAVEVEAEVPEPELGLDTPRAKPKRTRKPKTVEAEEPSVEGDEPAVEAKPKRKRKVAAAEPESDAATADPELADATSEAPAKPKRTRKPKAEAVLQDVAVDRLEAVPTGEPGGDDAEPVLPLDADTAASESAASDEPKRGGWWQRTFGA